MKDIFNISPQLTALEHGAEPNLKFMIMHYYTSGFIERKEAEKFTDRYIKVINEALLKDVNHG